VEAMTENVLYYGDNLDILRRSIDPGPTLLRFVTADPILRR
jgi:hypothetical protein